MKSELASYAALGAARGYRAARPDPLREFGLGAQVLRDIGLRKIRLLTNSPRKIAGIHGFGLDVVGSVPLHSMQKENSKAMTEPRVLEGDLGRAQAAHRFAVVATRFNGSSSSSRSSRPRSTRSAVTAQPT